MNAQDYLISFSGSGSSSAVSSVRVENMNRATSITINGADILHLVSTLTGTTHQASSNTGATNESGFTGRPGGERYDGFYSIGYYGFFWSATEYSATHADVGIQYYDSNIMDGDWYKKQCGFSVRCIKN